MNNDQCTANRISFVMRQTRTSTKENGRDEIQFFRNRS